MCFFKQKTAYEMRISDWSSDVCSSDLVENYVMVSRLGLFDTILGVGMPYMASAFGIFLMRQAFKSVPIELHEAARIEGCGWLGILWRVYVPLARPTYLAYALVSVSTHWNNFLWPLIVTNSPETRPLTVGLSIFAHLRAGSTSR